MNKLEKKEYMNQWYKNNQEHIKQYRIDNYEHRKEYQEQWHKNHKCQQILQRKQWRKDNPDYNKSWLLEHPGYRKEYQKIYHKQYLQTEQGKAASQRRNVIRRIKEKDIINTLTSQEWLDSLEENNYKCFYCGIEFDCENLPERDHVIPISKGGHNTKENIVPACRSCNAKKHNKNTFPTHRGKCVAISST